MFSDAFFDSQLFVYVGIPLLIFIARICDVTIGTVRIIFVSRGKKLLAPLLGFLEVLIWISVISHIINNTNSYVSYIAYSAGFAAGTFIGIYIEEKLALGYLVIRIIIMDEMCGLKEKLSASGFGVTTMDAYGASKKVKIIYTIIKRKNLNQVLEIIHLCTSKAFYSIEDTRAAYHGIFPGSTKHLRKGFFNKFRSKLKRK